MINSSMKDQIGLSKPRRIAQTLAHEIRSGVISKGHQLQSENELGRRFSASRTTVRKGLEELARQGFITTKNGIGSFVTYDGTAIDNALGWTCSLTKTDARIETHVLEISQIEDKKLAKFLKIDTLQFLAVNRVRKLSDNGHCVSLERSRSPWRVDFQRVLEEGLVGDSLNKTFIEAGLIVNHGEEWADVVTELNEEDAQLIALPKDKPMLRMRRLSRDVNDQVIEYVESLLDPLRFGLHLEF